MINWIDVVKLVIVPIIVLFFTIFIGLIYKGIDRKLAAHMQARIGPPIRQPFRDVGKLFIKENIIPENAIPWIYNLAPIVALTSSVILMLYIPIGSITIFSGYGDLILILYLLILPALALIVGGFASGSPYATVGAQREMVMLMSYEFTLAITIISIVWKLSTISSTGFTDLFTFNFIVSHPVWNYVGVVGFIGLSILLFTLLVVIPGEMSKIPFDAPEAETEIAGGLLAEYSGRNLAMFYLADAVKSVVLGGIVVNLFFPYNISPYISRYIVLSDYAYIFADMIFFLMKVFIVIFFAVTFVRVAFARLKISQISYVYFVKLTIIALFGLAFIVLDALLSVV